MSSNTNIANSASGVDPSSTFTFAFASASGATLELAFRPAPPPNEPATADDKDLGDEEMVTVEKDDEEMQGMYSHVKIA
jgi:hypothetical protein